jgi:hypothetical protein
MPTEISGSTGVNKIQDNTIVNADINSSAAIAGSKLVMPTGSVLQVVQGTYATEASFNNTNFDTDSGLTASITPSSSSNKVLVSVTAAGCGKREGGNTSAYSAYRVAKVVGGSTSEVCIASPQQGYTGLSSSASFGVVSANYLDSPSTTSSIEYKLLYRTGGSGTGKFLAEDESGNQPTATILLMEIAG